MTAPQWEQRLPQSGHILSAQPGEHVHARRQSSQQRRSHPTHSRAPGPAPQRSHSDMKLKKIAAPFFYSSRFRTAGVSEKKKRRAMAETPGDGWFRLLGPAEHRFLARDGREERLTLGECNQLEVLLSACLEGRVELPDLEHRGRPVGRHAPFEVPGATPRERLEWLTRGEDAGGAGWKIGRRVKDLVSSEIEKRELANRV